jgi:uncharacterized protein
MDMQTLTLALVGGSLIGIASSALLLVTGRVSGVSGIDYGLVTNERGQRAWKSLFLAGLVLGGAGLGLFHPPAFAEQPLHGLPTYLAAGLLIGFGSRLGGGCTSGHGICGVSRLSVRSLIVVVTWIVSGALVLWLVRAMGGN